MHHNNLPFYIFYCLVCPIFLVVISCKICLSILPSVATFAENLEENTLILEETQEIEPRASLYFSAYAYGLEPSSKKGYLDFSSLVAITDRTDKVRVTVQIQQYNDGWEDYGEEYVGTSSRVSYPFDGTVKVDRGEEYRAKFYYEAIVNDKVVEKKIFKISGIIAP